MWLVQMNEQEHQALMNPIRIQSGWRTRGTGKGPTQKARQAPEGLTVLLGEQPKCRDGNDLGWRWLSNQSSEQPGSSDQKTESSPRKAWRLGVERGREGLPCWLIDEESACQCRRHWFNLWSRKIPHDVEQLSPRATTLEPRSCNEKPSQWEAHAPQLE